MAASWVRARTTRTENGSGTTRGAGRTAGVATARAGAGLAAVTEKESGTRSGTGSETGRRSGRRSGRGTETGTGVAGTGTGSVAVIMSGTGGTGCMKRGGMGGTLGMPGTEAGWTTGGGMMPGMLRTRAEKGTAGAGEA